MSTVQAEVTPGSTGWGLVLVQGIAALILGLFVVSAPTVALTVLVTFVGAYWLVAGILSITRIFTGTGGLNWFWALVVGVLAIFAGLLVLRHPLYSSAIIPAVLVLVLGIDGVIMGLVNIYRALAGEGAGVGAIGVADIVFGALLLLAPLVAANVLTVLIGVFALIAGVALVAISFSMRNWERQAATGEYRRAA